jgi:hypothetical protein
VTRQQLGVGMTVGHFHVQVTLFPVHGQQREGMFNPMGRVNKRPPVCVCVCSTDHPSRRSQMPPNAPPQNIQMAAAIMRVITASLEKLTLQLDIQAAILREGPVRFPAVGGDTDCAQRAVFSETRREVEELEAAQEQICELNVGVCLCHTQVGIPPCTFARRGCGVPHHGPDAAGARAALPVGADGWLVRHREERGRVLHQPQPRPFRTRTGHNGRPARDQPCCTTCGSTTCWDCPQTRWRVGRWDVSGGFMTRGMAGRGRGHAPSDRLPDYAEPSLVWLTYTGRQMTLHILGPGYNWKGRRGGMANHTQ